MLTGLSETIAARKSKELSTENIRLPTTSNSSVSPKSKGYNSTIRVEFKGSCLKQESVTFAPIMM